MLALLIVPLLAAFGALALLAYATSRNARPAVAPSRHARPAAGDASYRPRSWDVVTSDSLRTVPVIPGPVEQITYDLLDPRRPLEEVEAELVTLGFADWSPLSFLDAPADLTATELYAEAMRENWARGRVAEEGKSWETHLAKFSGAVLPREGTPELEPVA